MTDPVPGARLTVLPVAVIEAEPEKLGEAVAPLPLNVAAAVVIVYVPAGSAVPLSVIRYVHRQPRSIVASPGFFD